MPEHHGGCYITVIEGQTFAICTKRSLDEPTPNDWFAWSFFAYDQTLNIYPADAVPNGIKVQESIAGESGRTEDEARRAVEATLLTVLQTRCLDGTGFYSPPAGFVYPHEFPNKEE